jgi:hypothetical protein
MKGEVHIKAYRGDELVEEFHQRNLIVTAGKTSMRNLLAGSGTNKYVSKISFGTSGTAPAVGDTAITDAFTKAIDSVTYPDASTIRFNWSLATSEANGKDIQEFGLLSNDNTLFARLTRATISKTSDLRLEGTWTISL